MAETIKYGVRLPDGQRFEVKDLETLRKTYPTGHITHRVVEDENGDTHNEEFKGLQPYEVAERAAERQAEKDEAAKQERVDQIRAMTVFQLREVLRESRIAEPSSGKKDDLVEAVMVSEGLSDPKPADAPESETKATPAGDEAKEVSGEESSPKVGVESENVPVSRDTGRR